MHYDHEPKPEAGGGTDTASLFSVMYPELRDLAERQLRRERKSHTLLPSAIVHEAFLRLADDHTLRRMPESRFMAVASRAMREILVDHARGRSAQKRGGSRHRVSLGDLLQSEDRGAVDIVALDDALATLAREHPRAARIVELRFFGGMQETEVATELAISRTTVQGEWRLARAWLHEQLC